MGFNELVQFIKNFEAVAAGTPNRPLRQLDENIRFLRDVIEAAEIGATVFARNQTVEAETLIGSPVFFNATSQRFERGLAAVETDLASGQLVTAASSHIWGVVAVKMNSTNADILLFGHATLDISAVVDEPVTAGIYYLSGVTEGKLVRQRPPVSVPILRADDAGNILVNIQWKDFLNDHVHFKFDLVALPAGEHTPPAPGGTHEITSPDSSQEGWLPADDPVFNGNAPAGALFGYNLSADTDLDNAWPPLPTDSSYLEWDKAIDKDQGFHGVASDLIILDRNGIWWLSNCFGDVPWPEGLDTSSSESVSAAVCPRELDFAIRLWFNKMTFLTDSSAVTSLISDDPRIQVLCETDPENTARTGPLLLRLALQFLIGDLNTRGFRVAKEFDEDTNKFNFGPVAEGVYALTKNITLTSPLQTKLIAGDDSSPDVHHGPIGIEVDTQGDREIGLQIVRLNGVTEEFFRETTYLGYQDDEANDARFKFDIPSTLEVATPKLRIRLRILGRAAGTLPALTLTGRRVLRPTTGPIELPAVDTAIVIDTTGAISANEYIEAESDPIDVAAGDMFLFTISRDEVDGFAGEVGILQAVGIIEAGT